ncbi:c-type cytochrome biogenesis protein CcmI [Sinimarinibacterium sp. CAU 1509]|uniref:c-type cytochrome biogenesis protein CcmI n=1 Tax=Sinimarinibacterium sp. CAU 1509 TaxID=2562283 RepID=UPI0010ACE378|nr:c-type cytochrome biogenesis protein CcmI [Sinimarinibacterium sp. CAU 1509]TJY60849.1 c-type cytochrome biogenesis protein CcmI [Sinimarinibacterium sp. CAU 1509]
MTIALMVVLALAAVVWMTRPLWRAHLSNAGARQSYNVAAYRQRVADIDADLALNTLEDEAAQQLREEAAARLLSDTTTVDAASSDAESVQPRAWILALVLVTFVAGVAGVGYFRSDSRQISGWIDLARKDPEAANGLVVSSMLQRLENRLKSEPDDAEGWAMLGRSYFTLGRHAEAAQAYAKANALTAGSPDPDWLASEGEARAFQQQGDMSGAPAALFAAALKVDPGYPKALWYAGLAAAHAEQYGAALDAWLKLRDQDLPDDFRQILEQRLPELAKLAARELPQRTAQAAPGGTSLHLSVDIDPALNAPTDGSATLLLFVRRPQGGPPLAAVRQPFTGPIEVVLDDSNAMIQGNNLSSADQWQVVARVTRGGGVQAQSGDLEGHLALSRDDAATPQRVLIDQRVP